MGAEAPDNGGGLGASQPASGAGASCPTSGAGEPLNIATEQDSGDKLNTITMSHLNNALSHLQIIIKAEDEKPVNEGDKITLVYKCHDCGQCCDRPEFVLKHINNCSPTTENVKLRCVCGLIFDIDKHNFAHHCELHRKENGNKQEVLETNKAVDAIKPSDTTASYVEERTTDKDETEESLHHEADAADTKESSADVTEQKPMAESQNTTDIDASENNAALGNIFSPDEIILPTREEDEELFREPSLLLVYDFLSREWKVGEYGEVIILKHSGMNYQLQFRRYHRDIYEISLVMTLKKSFKLQRMNYDNHRAWKWTFHYITERGIGEFQSLAVSFVSPQKANEFYHKINECMLTLKNGWDVLGARAEESFLSPSQPIGLISYTTTPIFGAPPTFGASPTIGSALPIFGTSSPTASPRASVGTVLQAKSAADGFALGASHFGADWTTPTSSKSTKIGRNTSNTEITRYNHEEYQIKRPVPLIAPKLKDIETFFRNCQNKIQNEDKFVAKAEVIDNTAEEDSKLSLVYKCQACGLCFDRPEILLNKHLSICSPTATLVKTTCICGLLFDKYNFAYHCEVHREFTSLSVKKIVVRDEGNIDVSGMKEEFMEDGIEANENKTTVKNPVVEHDESNGTVVTEEATSNLLAVKPNRVYKCLCRLSFDRAEFFIKHLKHCSTNVQTVKTTCVCGLVFDKHNFDYHCEVHLQFTLLNVKEIFVRDERTIDIREMVKEFIEDEEIKVVEKVALEENADQSQNLIKIPVATQTTERNGSQKKMEYHQTGSTVVEQNNAESKDKANNEIPQETDKTAENSTTTHEYNNANAVIESHENKTGGSQETSSSVSKEVFVSTESSNGEKSELPDNSEQHGRFTKKNNYGDNEKDLDLAKLKTDETIDDSTSTNEEKQRESNETTAIDSDNNIGDTVEQTLVKGESHVEANNLKENKTENEMVHEQPVITVVDQIDHGVEIEANKTINFTKNGQEIKEIVENANEKKDIQETDKEIQETLSTETKEINGEIEICNEEMSKLLNNSESHSKSVNESDYLNNGKGRDPNETIDSNISTIEEKQRDSSDTSAMDSDNKIGVTVEQTLVKDERHVEANNLNENKTENEMVHDQPVIAIDQIDHGVVSEANKTINFTKNGQEIKEIVKYTNEKKEIQETDKEIQEVLSNETKEINDTIEISNKEMSKLCNNSESHSKSINESDHLNNEKGPDPNETMDSNISTIEENQKCYRDTKSIDSDRKTDDEVAETLAEDESHVEKDIMKEYKMEEKLEDHQTEIPVVDNLEHGAKNEGNKILDSTLSAEEIEEKKQIIDGNNEDNKKNNEMGESQEASSNATKEINITIETSNAKSELLDKPDSRGDIINKSDNKNIKIDTDLVNYTTDKINDNNTSTVQEKKQNISVVGAVISDKKTGDISINHDEKRKQTSNATNSDQKPSNQIPRNANPTNNKRTNKKKNKKK